MCISNEIFGFRVLIKTSRNLHTLTKFTYSCSQRLTFMLQGCHRWPRHEASKVPSLGASGRPAEGRDGEEQHADGQQADATEAEEQRTGERSVGKKQKRKGKSSADRGSDRKRR